MALTDGLDGIIEAGRRGNPRALGRMITMIENESPLVRDLMKALAPVTGHAHVVGLTGSPGVGKSTSTSALITELTRRGQRVGVLAVDPSSPFSGGALLGDRVRMQKHATNKAVFIRSMASRGHLGGLASAASQALRVFDLAGFDTVLVETVGVGQSEVEIVETADTVLVLLAPGMGDGVQAAKAGILEIGDIFVVNKADHEGAPSLIRDLRTMISLGSFADDQWVPPIISTVASREEGVQELVDQILAHRQHGEASGAWERRRRLRAANEVQALVLGTVSARIRTQTGAALSHLSDKVRQGGLDPYTAADELLAQLRQIPLG